MKLSDPITISPDVVARMVGDETLLLDLASGAYFGLDPIGGRIWQVLEDGRPPFEACEAIFETHDVARAVLQRDVADLLDRLLERGLISLG